MIQPQQPRDIKDLASVVFLPSALLRPRGSLSLVTINPDAAYLADTGVSKHVSGHEIQPLGYMRTCCCDQEHSVFRMLDLGGSEYDRIISVVCKHGNKT